ncbi:MAG: hypothetical protein ACMUJM_11185 [bacterium]
MKKILIIFLFCSLISCVYVNETAMNQAYLSITLNFIAPEAQFDFEISTVHLLSNHTPPLMIPLHRSVSLEKRTSILIEEMTIPAGYYKSIDFDIINIKSADQTQNEAALSNLTLTTSTRALPFYIKAHSHTHFEFDVHCSLKDGEVLFTLTDSYHNKQIGLKGQLVYITNEGDNNVAVIDRLSGSQIALIPVGENPRGIVLDENCMYAYVANSQSNSISVIDTATKKIDTTIILGLGLEPEGIAISPDDEYVVTANRSSDNVSIIGVKSRRVIRHIPVRRGPSRIALSIQYTPSKEYWAFITNRYSSELSIVRWIDRDATLEQVEPDSVSLKKEPVGIITLDEDDASVIAHLIIANYGANLLTDLTLSSNSGSVTENIRYDSTFISSLIGPIDMVYDKRRKRMYISNHKSNSVSCVLYSMNIIESTIPVGINPMGMALDESRRLLYVVNNGDNTVSIINLSQGKVISAIPVGARPWGIVIDRRGIN